MKKIRDSPYEIWAEGKGKKYRDCITLLDKVLPEFDLKLLPPIVVVSNKKLGSGAISSYNHNDDVIYYNNYYHNIARVNQITEDESFVSNNLKDIILHELGHKMHWDAVKRFYNVNKSKYNNIEEEKLTLDENVSKYIGQQESSYLIYNVSTYAFTSYLISKKNYPINSINEVIAEEVTKNWISDPILHELIKGELNYGKN